MAIQFSEEKQKKVDKIIARYPADKKQSALIPLLHVAQDEFGGWLDTPHLDYVAEVLEILPVEVYEVASFYTMFNLNPVGKFVLEVCQTGPCMLRGSDKIIEHIKTKLNIEVGGTSADGLFTLKPASSNFVLASSSFEVLPLPFINSIFNSSSFTVVVLLIELLVVFKLFVIVLSSDSSSVLSP